MRFPQRLLYVDMRDPNRANVGYTATNVHFVRCSLRYEQKRMQISRRGVLIAAHLLRIARAKTTVSGAGLGAAAPPPHSALFRLPGHKRG